ncbi:unnamed protein product [Tuber aestivum]|uniref:Uncharacterized protein n=1 Tax=Tuber aestivum TaxID=59557 RepID=A0A292PTV0_9PEZI|nr:unnamed protein product [Tuber aestivum]
MRKTSTTLMVQLLQNLSIRFPPRYICGLEDNESICVAVGAMGKGMDHFADGWVDEKTGVSNH